MSAIPVTVVLLFDPHAVPEPIFLAHQLPWGQMVHDPFVPKYPALHWHAVMDAIPVAVVLLFDPHAVPEATF
jgi:P2-related tail formation protein